MLALGVIVLLLLIILGLLLLCVKRSARAQRIYTALSKKLFYNTFMRFVLQSSLKLQIAACTVIFYAQMLTSGETLQASETQASSLVPSATILCILNACPVIFFLAVYRNRDNLNKQVIKDKIGTLYVGLNPLKPLVWSSCLLFLLRRTFFVFLTFYLFSQPGIQVQLMIFSTVTYVIYLGHVEYYETPKAKLLEIVNETVFVLIQYNFVLLHNLVWEEQTRNVCGNVIVALTSLLLLLNLVVIVVVSIKGLCRKLYLRRIKK